MGAIDILRDALFGNPPSAATKPSREGVLSAFTDLKTTTEAGIAAAALSGTDLNAAMQLVAPLLTSAQASEASAASSAGAAQASYLQAKAVSESLPIVVAERLNDAVQDATQAATMAAQQAGAARDQANLGASAASASGNYFPTRAAGEVATPVGKLFSTKDAAGNLTYYEKTGNGSAAVSPGAFLTLSGTQTVTGNKTFAGPFGIATNGSRIGFTDAASPITPQALVNFVNTGSTTNGLRVTSYWTGTAAAPYQNNDNSLWETFNKIINNSDNYSWSISAPNAYNDIPAGIRDGGERVGVYGWATSVYIAGSYVHAGTLASQIGIRGRAGFQGIGTPITAVIESAVGVLGEIRADSPGATIQVARAGKFVAVAEPGTGTIQDNCAVYAEARGGTLTNFSFYGAAGLFFQVGPAIFGPTTTSAQSGARVSVRGTNGVEFGNADPSGYGSNIGATAASGSPFLAFCAEADPTGNGFRTRGKVGHVIRDTLDGQVIFSRLTNANAAGQAPTDDVIWRPNGSWLFVRRPRLFGTPPASATAPGEQWEIAVDDGYLYVCVADNTWKRTSLSSF